MKMRELLTDRLILKPTVLEHAPDWERHFVDYRVIRNLSDAVPWPYPSGGVEEFLKSVVLKEQGQTRFTYSIFLKINPIELIGVVDLWRNGTPEHRGFWLGHAFWGKGYMTEACEEINRLAFEELGFEKLIFSNAVGNSKSGRVKEKTGAKRIGVKPTKFVDPLFTEAELWELSREEWEAHRESLSC